MENQTDYKKGNTILKAILVGIVILFLFLWFNGCFRKSNSDSQQIITVKHAKIVGSTSIVKPESKPLEVNYSNGSTNGPNNAYLSGKSSATPFKNNTSTSGPDNSERWKHIADSLLNENIRMQVAFAKSKNKDSLYREAIKINAFTHTWDNDTLKATVSGLSRGTVEGLKLDYTIKPTTEQIKVPITTFRLLAGGGLGINKDLSQATYKVNLGFQNKKGNIIRGSYQQIGSEKFGLLEYDFSIFSIKSK